jgi:hypothetical protein
MKKLVIVLLVVGSFWACKEQGPVRYTSTSSEIDHAKALIKDYEDGNWESWMTHYADTAKVFHNSIEAISPAELAENFKVTLADVASYEFNKDDQFTEMILDDKGETWVYFWGTWEGTMNGNDQKLVTPVHVAWNFVDNKIVKEYAYYDQAPRLLMMQEMEAGAMTVEE